VAVTSIRAKDAVADEPAVARSFAATVLFFLLFAAWVGEWPLELDNVLYLGQWRSTFVIFGPLFEPLPGIRLFPWQVLLLLTVPFCLQSSLAPDQRSPELNRAILVSFASVVLTVLWGAIRGGSLYFAYYQVWRFLAALLLAYVLVGAMRSPRDLVTLAKIVILAALIRGSLVIYFYWIHVRGKMYPVPEYMTNHDDSLLFVMAILIVGTWALIQGGKATWMKATLVTLYLFYAIVLNDRRIAWVELVMAAAAIYLLIGPGPVRTTVNKILIALLPILIVYIAIGWGREGAIFSPVQALTSVKDGDDPSSLTRQEELRNLLYTLSTNGNPLFGTGWGRPYEIVERIWSNYPEDWILVPYTPHNSLVGLAVFSGLVGIFGIWGVVTVAGFLGALGYRTSKDPVPRAAALVAVGTLVAYGVHCYGDIGLQSFACCTMFGAAMATAAKVAAWGGGLSPAPKTARSIEPAQRATRVAPIAARGAHLAGPEPSGRHRL
jgi:O-Antigen ligase